MGKIVGGCIAGSAIIALILLIALKLCPEVIVGVMSFTTIVVIVAVALIDIISIKSGIASYFLFIALMYAVFLCNYWDNLRKASILMKTVGNFIVENPKILFLIFFTLVYCSVMLFLWVAGFY